MSKKERRSPPSGTESISQTGNPPPLSDLQRALKRQHANNAINLGVPGTRQATANEVFRQLNQQGKK